MTQQEIVDSLQRIQANLERKIGVLSETQGYSRRVASKIAGIRLAIEEIRRELNDLAQKVEK